MLSGPPVSARACSKSRTDSSTVRYAQASDPRPPAFDTAAASCGVPGPPPIGAWMIGWRMPSLRSRSVAINLSLLDEQDAQRRPAVPGQTPERRTAQIAGIELDDQRLVVDECGEREVGKPRNCRIRRAHGEKGD